MTPDAVIRQWFKEVWNEKNEQTIDRLLTADSVVHGLGGTNGDLRGPEGFKAVFHAFHDALENIQVDVEKTLVDGDLCTALCRVRGRHTGNGLGGPPSGKEVNFTGAVTARVRDGKLVEGWNNFDFLTMYQQVGWIPDPVVPPKA